jgi:hypothetical protein
MVPLSLARNAVQRNSTVIHLNCDFAHKCKSVKIRHCQFSLHISSYLVYLTL